MQGHVSLLSWTEVGCPAAVAPAEQKAMCGMQELEKLYHSISMFGDSQRRLVTSLTYFRRQAYEEQNITEQAKNATMTLIAKVRVEEGLASFTM